ncbi:hypothetical protein Cgig2_008429 [Carnegiea gigantea]|uniref:Pentatricopeptide repeat-containing protein n=1 Tax=Carnegiea gigantea TaxID=171969 RepID=A0A9Q1Q6S1_9CARY|nr:hypothetical protein Cgig2_008429 [Carnegiea gigantea]
MGSFWLVIVLLNSTVVGMLEFVGIEFGMTIWEIGGEKFFSKVWAVKLISSSVLHRTALLSVFIPFSSLDQLLLKALMKMLRGRKIVQISLHFWLQSAMHAHGVYPKCVSRICNFYAACCTCLQAPNTADSPSVIESPALPNWVKFCENENPSMEESDDEFVLPKVAGSADTKNLNDDHTRHVKHIACEITDSDANGLAEVLRERFNSSDAVCSALAICDGIDLSESLMVKILQRFSNDWISAFGFFKWAKNKAGYVP